MLTTIFLIIAGIMLLLMLVGIFVSLVNLVKKGFNSKNKKDKTNITSN